MRSLLNLSIRGLTIGTRFLFVVILGRELGMDILGQYSYIVTTVAILVLIFGLEFHIDSTREVVRASADRQWALIRRHFRFGCFVSAALVVSVFGAAFFGLFEQALWPVLSLLFVFEYWGMECYRMLNALEETVKANIILFLKSASWSGVLLPILYFDLSESMGIQSILFFWMIGAGLSTASGFAFIAHRYKGVKGLSDGIGDIGTALKASMWLLCSAVAFKVVEFSDRYLIEYFMDFSSLGVYAFYFQFANLINVVIYTVVIAEYYPAYYRSIEGNGEDLQKLHRSMLRQSLGIGLGLGLFVIISTPFIAEWMEKEVLIEQWSVLLPMLAAILCFAWFHLDLLFLRAKGEDRRTAIFFFSAALVNVILNVLLLPLFGIYGAAWSSLGAFILLKLLSSSWKRRYLSTT